MFVVRRYTCSVLVPSSGCREFLSPALAGVGEKFFFPRSPTASFLQRLVFLLAAGSVCDQATWPPRPVSAISKPSPFFTKGFAVQAGMADLAIMEVAKYKMLMPPLPLSALDPSGHHHLRPDSDTTTRSCQFLTTGSVCDQATWPPRPVSAISKPSPFFTKGFAVQAGMADLAIMEVAKLKIYIRNCYVVLRTIGRLNGGPSCVPLPGCL